MDLVIVNRRFKANSKMSFVISLFSTKQVTGNRKNGLYRALALPSFTLLAFTQWLLSDYKIMDCIKEFANQF